MMIVCLLRRFKYSKAEDLKEEPYWGRVAVYGGGGYTQILPNSSDLLLHVLMQLQRDEYIDAGTRAVFVDFTAYNPYENLFAVARSPTYTQLNSIYVIQTPLGGVDPLTSDDTPHLAQSRPPLAGYIIHKVA